MRILEVERLSKHFGGLAAVSGVDFHIEQGEILGLIGPNGAGKTTTFNLIYGLERPTSGIIRLKDEDITGLKPHQICRRNVAKTFQSIKLFPHMTVHEKSSNRKSNNLHGIYIYPDTTGGYLRLTDTPQGKPEFRAPVPVNNKQQYHYNN